MRVIITLLVAITFTICLISSCSEEIAVEGTLQIYFLDDSPDVIEIYSMEDKEHPIEKITTKGVSKAKINLNMGNYLLHMPNTPSNNMGGFQIRPKETTRASYTGGEWKFL